MMQHCVLYILSMCFVLFCVCVFSTKKQYKVSDTLKGMFLHLKFGQSVDRLYVALLVSCCNY